MLSKQPMRKDSKGMQEGLERNSKEPGGWKRVIQEGMEKGIKREWKRHPRR